MTKLDKLLTTTALAALLAGGLAVVPQEAFAQAMNPCAPKATKAANPCAPKVANPCAPKAGKTDAGKSMSYELLFPQQPGQNG